MRYGKAFGKRDPELIEDDVVRILIGVPDAGEESPTQQVPPQVIRLLNVLKEGELNRGLLMEKLGPHCSLVIGTDIKFLEFIMFMHDAEDQAYYEQMKGRSTNVISLDELYKVIHDAPGENRFVASGFCKSKEVHS